MDLNPVLIGLQVIPFLVALVGLHFIIFKPMLRYLGRRERSIADDRREAEVLQGQVEEKVAELENKLATARAEAASERQRLRDQIRAEEQEILDRARERADALVEEARTQIAAEREAARRTLRDETETLAKDIAASVLGRAV